MEEKLGYILAKCVYALLKVFPHKHWAIYSKDYLLKGV